MEANTQKARLLTLREAAQYLNCSQFSIRTLVWDGTLPSVRFTRRGKLWLDLKDLEKYIEDSKRENAPPARN